MKSVTAWLPSVPLQPRSVMFLLVTNSGFFLIILWAATKATRTGPHCKNWHSHYKLFVMLASQNSLHSMPGYVLMVAVPGVTVRPVLRLPYLFQLIEQLAVRVYGVRSVCSKFWLFFSCSTSDCLRSEEVRCDSWAVSVRQFQVSFLHNFTNDNICCYLQQNSNIR